MMARQPPSVMSVTKTTGRKKEAQLRAAMPLSCECVPMQHLTATGSSSFEVTAGTARSAVRISLA